MRSSLREIVYGGFYSPPFMNYTEQGHLQGPLIDLAVQIANYFRLTPIFKILSQEELNHFYNSSFDVGLGVFETESRKVLGEFSYPFVQIGLRGLGLKNYSDLRLDDLVKRNVKFGVKEGEIGHDFLMRYYGYNWVKRHCKVLPEASTLLSWSLLENHECDVVLCDTLTLTHWKNNITESTWLTFTEPIYEINMCFLVNFASPLSVDDINHWLVLHTNTTKYKKFVSSVWNKNETRYKFCLIPPL